MDELTVHRLLAIFFNTDMHFALMQPGFDKALLLTLTEHVSRAV
jgi:hypothetical protein